MKCIVAISTTTLHITRRVCVAGVTGLLLILSACVGGAYQPGYDPGLPQYNVPDGGQ